MTITYENNSVNMKIYRADFTKIINLYTKYVSLVRYIYQIYNCKFRVFGDFSEVTDNTMQVSVRTTREVALRFKPDNEWHILDFGYDRMSIAPTTVVNVSTTLSFDYIEVEFSVDNQYIYCFNNTKEDIVVDKNISVNSFALRFRGIFRDNIDLINPIFDIEWTQIPTFNYVYLNMFGRYYFVDNIECVRNNLYRIYCSIDVLMSYREQLKDLQVYVTRQENNFDDLMPDSKVPSRLEFENSYGRGDGSELYNSINVLDHYTTTEEPMPYVLSVSTNHTAGDEVMSPYLPFNRISFFTRHGISTLADFVYSATFINAFKYDVNTNATLNWKLLFEEPMDGIINLRLYPFDVFRKIRGGIKDNVVYIGNKEVAIPKTGENEEIYNTGYISISSNSNIYVYGGHIDLKPLLINNDNFLSQAPYTSIQIIIPYYGSMEIDITQFPTRDIAVVYVIDIYSNVCDILVMDKSHYVSTSTADMNNSMKYVVYNTSISMGIDIPLSSISANENAKKVAGTVIKAAGSVASMAITAATGVPVAPTPELTPVTHRPTQRYLKRMDEYRQAKQEYHGLNAGKVIQTVSDITVDVISAMQLKYSVGQCGSGWNWWQRDNELLVNIKQVKAYYPTNYNHLVGKPSRYSGRLGDLTGYTEVGAFHLEGINGITTEEKDLLEKLLRSGIIM